MINKDKLFKKMVEEESFTVELLAQETGISHAELFLKIIGFLEFRCGDIEKIADILCLTEDEINQSFFVEPQPAKTVSVEIPAYMLEKIKEIAEKEEIFSKTNCSLSDVLKIVLLEGIGSQLVSGW